MAKSYAYRHEHAHKNPEYNKLPLNKIEFSDVRQELLGNKNPPESPEGYQKLQIEVLKRLDGTVGFLLNIVKEKLSHQPKPLTP